MRKPDWITAVLVLLISFMLVAGGTVFYFVLTYEPPPEPRWRQVLDVSYPIRVGQWDEDTATWENTILPPQFVHRFNITGNLWKVFLGGTMNESAENPFLAVTLFAVYPTGRFYDAILLDMFLLRDFRSFDFEISERQGSGQYQLFIFAQDLESYGVTVTEYL